MVQPLLIVDVQKGFLNEFTRHIPGRISELVALKRFDPLLFTRFVNVPDSPYVRLLDWDGCSHPPETDLAPEMVDLAKQGLVFEKPGSTGLPDSLATYLADHEIREIALAGIDTDMCVLKCALDIFDLGITPIVLTDCCASTAGLQAHLAGLAILSRNVGPRQLRETGLGRGVLAAPEPGQPTVPSEWVKGTGGAP